MSRPTHVSMHDRVKLIEHCHLFGKGNVLTTEWLAGVSPDDTFHVASNVAWIMYFEHIPVPQWFLNTYGGIGKEHHTRMDPLTRKCHEKQGAVFHTTSIQRAVLTERGQIRSRL
jgi:hypothetical protein